MKPLATWKSLQNLTSIIPTTKIGALELVQPGRVFVLDLLFQVTREDSHPSWDSLTCIRHGVNATVDRQHYKTWTWQWRNIPKSMRPLFSKVTRSIKTEVRTRKGLVEKFLVINFIKCFTGKSNSTQNITTIMQLNIRWKWHELNTQIHKRQPLGP